MLLLSRNHIQFVSRVGSVAVQQVSRRWRMSNAMIVSCYISGNCRDILKSVLKTRDNRKINKKNLAGDSSFLIEAKVEFPFICRIHAGAAIYLFIYLFMNALLQSEICLVTEWNTTRYVTFHTRANWKTQLQSVQLRGTNDSACIQSVSTQNVC